MTRSRALVLVAVTTVMVVGSRALADGDPPARRSLALESATAAWQRAGFRLHLGAVYGRLIGRGGAPSGREIGVKLRAGLRLDHDWSVLASFEYSLAREHLGLDGLHFAGTVEPTLHVAPDLAFAVGFGFGGIVEGRTSRPDPDPLASSLETSYTFPDASTPVRSCSGVGAVGLVRAEWTRIIGPRTAVAFSLETLAQWTGCVDETGRVEPDTAKAIVRRQWWPHVGLTLSIGVTWR